MLGRVGHILYNKYWEYVIRSPWVNRKVNRELSRIEETEEEKIGLPLHTLNLSADDYKDILGHPNLQVYKRYPFYHRKLVEYLTSYKLVAENKNIQTFCDFASGGDLYTSFVGSKIGGISIYSIDPLNRNEVRNGVTYVKGDASRIDLPDQILDAITCHHSIEHFRNDQDTSAVSEFCRLLKPGGIAVIVPVFICNRFAEIWNVSPEAHYDINSVTVKDRFSTFPGWSRFEHFARVYDVNAFRKRIVSVIDPEKFTAEIWKVKLDGVDMPDMLNNRDLPQFNEKMLALRIIRHQQ